MTLNEFYKLIRNKIGEIYVARKGTVTVFLINGNTYLVSNTSQSAVIVNPVPGYWSRSIDWAGGFTDYFTFGMCPHDKLTYNAKPIVPITAERLAKLKNLVN